MNDSERCTSQVRATIWSTATQIVFVFCFYLTVAASCLSIRSSLKLRNVVFPWRVVFEVDSRTLHDQASVTFFKASTYGTFRQFLRVTAPPAAADAERSDIIAP